MDEVFTTDPKATPVHVASWGFLGDTWPYFRPNFVNMESYREEHGVDEVRSRGQALNVLSCICLCAAASILSSVLWLECRATCSVFCARIGLIGTCLRLHQVAAV